MLNVNYKKLPHAILLKSLKSRFQSPALNQKHNRDVSHTVH